MTTSLWTLEATELAALIRSGQVSAREAVESHLARMDAVNPQLNAVVRTLHEEARAAADEADRRQRAGEPLGPLHGVPVTTKITTDQQGLPTDNGLVMFKDQIARDDAPSVRNLRQAGAVIIGRTNSPALAMRFMTDNQLHGLTRNPWGRDITCGGSSGGAGAAAAVGIGALAHGSDIGGSVRWPAFCNGIVGLRPTPGRIANVSTATALPTPMAAQIMAVNGPLARSVRDTRLGFEVMAGQGHPMDPYYVPAPLHGLPPVPRRAALVLDWPGVTLDPEAAAAVREAGRRLSAAGWAVEEAAPPGLERAYRLWEILGLDEIRTLMEPLMQQLADPDLETAHRAWWAVSAQVDLRVYRAALTERHALMKAWGEFLSHTPLVITPVGAQKPPAADADVRPGGMVSLLDQFGRFLFPAPVLGLPVLTVPVGAQGRWPQGVQLYAAKYREDVCLDAGELIEAWDGVRPVINPQW